MSKMGASALLNERMQTRILQAAGRCTRALQDRSAVFVTGNELLDYLADDRNWHHFHPELQAELSFGVHQSKESKASAMMENFKSFIANDADWDEANTRPRGLGTDYPASCRAMAAITCWATALSRACRAGGM